MSKCCMLVPEMVVTGGLGEVETVLALLSSLVELVLHHCKAGVIRQLQIVYTSHN